MVKLFFKSILSYQIPPVKFNRDPDYLLTVLVPSPDLVGIRLRKTDLCKLSLDAGLPGALVSSEQAHTRLPG